MSQIPLLTKKVKNEFKVLFQVKSFAKIGELHITNICLGRTTKSV